MLDINKPSPPLFSKKIVRTTPCLTSHHAKTDERLVESLRKEILLVDSYRGCEL